MLKSVWYANADLQCDTARKEVIQTIWLKHQMTRWPIFKSKKALESFRYIYIYHATWAYGTAWSVSAGTCCGSSEVSWTTEASCVASCVAIRSENLPRISASFWWSAGLNSLLQNSHPLSFGSSTSVFTGYLGKVTGASGMLSIGNRHMYLPD